MKYYKTYNFVFVSCPPTCPIFQQIQYTVTNYTDPRFVIHQNVDICNTVYRRHLGQSVLLIPCDFLSVKNNKYIQ